MPKAPSGPTPTPLFGDETKGKAVFAHMKAFAAQQRGDDVAFQKLAAITDDEAYVNQISRIASRYKEFNKLKLAIPDDLTKNCTETAEYFDNAFEILSKAQNVMSTRLSLI